MPMFKCVISFMIMTCYAIFREEVADVGVPISPMHTGGRVFGVGMRKFSANNFLPPPTTYLAPRLSSDSQSSDSFKPRQSQDSTDLLDTTLLNYPTSPNARKLSNEKQVPSPLSNAAPSANTPTVPSIKVSAATDKALPKKLSLPLPSTPVEAAYVEPGSITHPKGSADSHHHTHEAVKQDKAQAAIGSASKSAPVDDIEDDLIWFELTQKLAELPPEDEAKSPRAAKRSITLPPKRSSRSAY